MIYPALQHLTGYMTMDFLYVDDKDADQLRGNREELISAFVFPIRIVQSLYYLYPEFQASSYPLWL